MAKLTAEIRNLADAEKFLAGKKTRKLANNTYVERPDYSTDIVGVRLHATVIVTYHRDGRIILNTGGWNTPTTRDRLHQLTPREVFVSGAKGDRSGRAADLVVSVREDGEILVATIADQWVTIQTDPATGEILDIVGDRA